MLAFSHLGFDTQPQLLQSLAQMHQIASIGVALNQVHSLDEFNVLTLSQTNATMATIFTQQHGQNQFFDDNNLLAFYCRPDSHEWRL
jgi:hypothetical protein